MYMHCQLSAQTSNGKVRKCEPTVFLLTLEMELGLCPQQLYLIWLLYSSSDPTLYNSSFFEGSFNVTEQKKILPVHGQVRKVGGWSSCSDGPRSDRLTWQNAFIHKISHYNLLHM